MKKTLLFVGLFIVALKVQAQTNTFPSSGNTGIGTLSPAYPLDVMGSLRTNGYSIGWDGSTIKYLLANDGGNSYLASGKFGIGNTSPSAKLQVNGVKGNLYIDDGNNGYNYYDAFERHTFRDMVGNVRLSINAATGLVGIGTANPEAGLQVQESGHARIRLATANDPVNYYTDIISSWSSGDAFKIQHKGINILKASEQGYEKVELGNGSSLNINLLTSTGGKITIPNGNIGIGTNNPQEKLSVNGTILAKKVKVSTASVNWPDYVFASNYKLRSLSSLEAYIKRYKHLPDIPSATDIKDKGIDIVALQAAMLKKIEELTLYIIELKKEVDELKKK